eukprot:CAMPEP_0205937294 /NCGR_PEP_ID=MMETSP1325-20131115/43810_1 /ASSEMBLY_ACC=CAM_ASM_000708 /TAXON_ID=236786 /ORGANISM="Florenciella sp., Strain RCC1007" /LENGTH=44 /DNA_ID= /DNA_START= /DNA_END= /DNA_ORIENTATION=
MAAFQPDPFAAPPAQQHPHAGIDPFAPPPAQQQQQPHQYQQQSM